MKTRTLLICSLLAILCCSVELTAAPGNLDRTFSGDGKLTDSFPGENFSGATAVAVQADGKIVVTGQSSNPRYIYLGRYNEDGSPDTAFGDGTGKVTTQFGNFYNYVADILIQPDGKIVVAGCYCEEDFGDYALALARFNSDGSPDVSFGVNGVVLGEVAFANAIALQSDGKIVVGAWDGIFPNARRIERRNIDGSLDATFGVNGISLTEGLHEATSIAIQADGKIIAAGSLSGNPFSEVAVVRYNSNGTLDTTFDNDGIATAGVTIIWGRSDALAIQSDGKLLLAGTRQNGADVDFGLARLNSNGSLDNSFGVGGIVTTPIQPEADNAGAVAIQPNGKIVVAGSSEAGSNLDFALVRYNSDGSIDTTLGGGSGKSIIDFGQGTSDFLYGMTLDKDGRAVLAGFSDGKIALARVLLASDTPFDFDGDRQSDLSVFRPSNSVWYLNRSRAGFAATQFGVTSDLLAPADYDGDGKTDIAVFRNGVWWMVRSSDSTVSSIQFGQTGDIPLPEDFTGDGVAELVVYRGGDWWSLDLSSNQSNFVHWGIASDKPVVGDYDGDGLADRALYREGVWYVLRSMSGPTIVQFGLASDIPVAADYDGDAKTDIAVYRQGVWYLLQSTNGFTAFQFGNGTDVPVPADYDGDGSSDAAIFRNGEWWLRQSAGSIVTHRFGSTGDLPVQSAYISH